MALKNGDQETVFSTSPNLISTSNGNGYLNGHSNRAFDDLTSAENGILELNLRKDKDISSEGIKKRSSVNTTRQEKMDGNIQHLLISSPSNRRGYATVGILFLINLLNYMDRYTIAGVLQKVQSDFQINDAQSGVLQTVFICAYMIFAPIFGYLGDRYSRKWIMVGGISVWSLTVLGSTFVPNNMFILFLLCRGVVGIGEASYSTVASTLIADLFTKDSRSKMLMIFYFAIPVGSGLGYIVGANVAQLFSDPDVGWRWGVRVTPVFGAVCLLLLIFIVREPKRGEIEHVSRVQTSSWLTDLVYLIKNRSFVWSTLGFTAVAFATGCLSWWTPTLISLAERLKTGRAPDDAQIGLIFGVVTVLAGFFGVIIGSFTAQMWRKRNPKADPLVCGIGILLSVPFLYFALTIIELNMPVAWVCVFFAVLCLSLNWAVVSDILMYIVPPSRRSTASAFQILFSHLFGDAASPYLVGIVSDAIRLGDESDAARFYALKYAMYIPDFILVFGGFFFLGTAWYVEADRKASELMAKAHNSAETNAIVPSGSSISDQGGNYGGVGDLIPSESRSHLIEEEEFSTNSNVPLQYRF